MKKIVKNLTFWVLTAILSGALLGHFYPLAAQACKPLGTYFIYLVKLFINPIILLTIVTGICGMGDLKKVGRIINQILMNGCLMNLLNQKIFTY